MDSVYFTYFCTILCKYTNIHKPMINGGNLVIITSCLFNDRTLSNFLLLLLYYTYSLPHRAISSSFYF